VGVNHKDSGVQAVLKESKQFNHLLEWCLIASLLIHALMMFTLPKPDYDLPPPKKQEIRIELVKEQPPAPVQPAAEPQPTPPKPQPEPPKPQPTPVKPEPKPVKHEPMPQKPSPEPVVETPRPVVESPTPPVIAAKPTVSEAKPEVVVPPPAPPAPPPEPVKAGPSEGDIDAARNAFRSAAHRELKKNQRYPRIAQDRGIEGDVKLSINMDDHGNITGIEIVESSGNKAIDDAAISAAQKSQLKQHFTEILRGKINNIIVTVSFKLAS
jgi:protein TonB